MYLLYPGKVLKFWVFSAEKPIDHDPVLGPSAYSGFTGSEKQGKTARTIAGG
jgi:hypothetical protein